MTSLTQSNIEPPIQLQTVYASATTNSKKNPMKISPCRISPIPLPLPINQNPLENTTAAYDAIKTPCETLEYPPLHSKAFLDRSSSLKKYSLEKDVSKDAGCLPQEPETVLSLQAINSFEEGWRGGGIKFCLRCFLKIYR